MATDKQKELKVTWTARPSGKYTEMEYTILYHARNEKENKVCWYSASVTLTTAIVHVF